MPEGAARIYRFGPFALDVADRSLKRQGTPIPLTPKTFDLLVVLVQNAGRVVSKGEILEKVWNVSSDTETRAVVNFIVRLRRYLEPNPRFPRHLHTVRGAGYRFVLDAVD